MYGLIEVSVCDGYSGKIVVFVIMLVKNNVLIYEYIYRYLIIINIVLNCNFIIKLRVRIVFVVVIIYII